MLARNDRTEMMGTENATPSYWPRRIARAALVALLAAALLTSAAAAAEGLTFSKLPGEMTVARWYPIAELLPGGKVLIAGGVNETAPLKSAELFDPSSGKFEALAAAMSTDREEASSVLLPSGKVLIAGGYGTKEGKEQYLDTAELFDPATSSFEALAVNMSHPRVGPAMALLPSGKVLIAGGADSSTWTPSAEIFDPASGKFEAIAGKMVVGEYSGSAATLPSGNVLIAGGYNGTGESLGTAEVFDPIAATFSALGPGNLPVEECLGSAKLELHRPTIGRASAPTLDLLSRRAAYDLAKARGCPDIVAINANPANLGPTAPTWSCARSPSSLRWPVLNASNSTIRPSDWLPWTSNTCCSTPK